MSWDKPTELCHLYSKIFKPNFYNKMKKIKNLSASRTTHNELAGVSAYYIKILEKFFSDNPFIMAVILLIKNALNNLNDALSAIRINTLIKEAFDLDQVRDSAFIVFRNMIAAFERSTIAEEKAAHDKLWPVIVRLGTTLYNDGYLEQSARLKILYREMAKPDRVAALEVLSLTDKLDRLKAADEAFNLIYDSKLDQESKQAYPTIREARKELSPLINDLIPTLRMLVRTVPSDADLSWVDLINEQTDLVMANIAARKTRKDNQEGEAADAEASSGSIT